MTIKALIPVRAGSDRVKNKNIRPFAGSSLLEIKIKQLQRIPGIDEICVNSDCENMLAVAKDLGATAIKRDAKYATSHVPMVDVWQNMAINMDCKDILYTNVTNPLVEDNTYNEIIRLWGSNHFDGDYPFNSITTTHPVIEYLWHDHKPVNYNPKSHPRSQDLPKYYGLNFAVSIIPKHLMVSSKSIIAKTFYPYHIKQIECIDIDDMEDFFLAETLYKAVNGL